ncbi:hypothetical protein EF847_10115 [Actinobacteria bacterium YIM 96077]|uniref:Uncharacterized protein n=1 Tax=Phytoactinopolyspora halophila TaxID=1981511 RepID=A0A329QRD0_9ACTN|nr:ImmA/IrrE family metallo-endopeptidase [Phytoactinopolyspora halophila]AYY13004.1 hypothetical protein EF847_10115 [Actinobacteria bacterium YIM 96077]RAW13268.1 hypothetical protein DPM12_13140 [Phytoactinopolyspora halophila]
MLPDLTAEAWFGPEPIAAATDHLLEAAEALRPGVLDQCRWDPRGALEAVPGLSIYEDLSLRPSVCPIDGTYDPAIRSIRYRPVSARRDRFTLLHEFGHDLLAVDTDWSLRVAPALDKLQYGRQVEEKIVNRFASRVLITDQEAAKAFAHGVTAEAAASLYDIGTASATACLVRSLGEPGQRMVILADSAGRSWFTESNGDPYAPSRNVRQPVIEKAAQRAIETGSGTFSGAGLGEIKYKSGKTFSDLRIDVAIRGGMVFAVVTALPRDLRVSAGFSEWHVECLAGCGHSFTQEESPRVCEECGEPKCPRCRECECDVNKQEFCSNCFMLLPKARKGHELCENCE